MGILEKFQFWKTKPASLGVAEAVPTEWGNRSAYDSLTAADVTPAQLLTILQAADAGDPADFFAYAKAIEKRDLHYASVLATRKAGVLQIAPRVVSVSDSVSDEAVADAVREHITGEPDQVLPTFRTLARDKLDALGKGLSVSEMVWDTSGPVWVPRFEWRDPRWFRYDKLTGRELHMITDGNRANDMPLMPGKWVIHEPQLITGLPVEGGLARGVAAMHLLKSLAVRDWAAFLDVFGLPLKVGTVANGTDAKAKESLRSAMRLLGTEASAVLTEGMKIEVLDGVRAHGGSDVFERFLAWVDKSISKHVVGQTMTVEDGSSLAQAVVHDNVRGDIRDADAETLEATINSCVVAPFVYWNFGPQVKLPHVLIRHEDPEDIQALANAIPKMVAVGLPIEASVILDRMNIPMPEPGAVILGQGGLSIMPTPDEIEDAARESTGQPTPQQDAKGEAGAGDDDDEAD